MTDLDLAFVRKQFPAFDDADLHGWAFFENAGGSYPCRQVVDRLLHFYTKTKVQPAMPYPSSLAASDAMGDARARLAGILGITPEALHIGPSTSANTYMLARAFRGLWAEGDEIIVTNQDHEANSGPWRRLAETGIVVREWGVNPETGHLDPATLAEMLGPRTRLVAFTHASNVVAEINEVPAIAAMVREAGAVTVVDGVSYAPHGLPDIGALGCDVYLFSTYKTWGPHQGVMAIYPDLARTLPNQGHYFNEDNIHARLSPSGPDHAQVAALAGVVDYIEALYSHHFTGEAAPAARGKRVHDMLHAAEARVIAPMLEWARSRNDVRLLGPSDPARRAPTVALVCKRPGMDVAADLAVRKIMCGGGDFYATRVIEAMGESVEHGVLRLSAAHYTTEAEVAQAVEALDAVL